MRLRGFWYTVFGHNRPHPPDVTFGCDWFPCSGLGLNVARAPTNPQGKQHYKSRRKEWIKVLNVLFVYEETPFHNT